MVNVQVLEEWAVDCRDEAPAFASVLTFPDRQEALTYARQTSRPLLRRETTVTTVSGDWLPA